MFTISPHSPVGQRTVTCRTCGLGCTSRSEALLTQWKQKHTRECHPRTSHPTAHPRKATA
ncbi:hypothetical protein [Serinicoccus sediminis]|uniref:hypothetical protein n=1 Tax=Serinicoccus sediminis TaxID=2306021 RepID=UPI001020583D|nr:hypothetical protein [Serinicoccus sediminis]